MTRIVIHDVHDEVSLAHALAVVRLRFENPDTFALDEVSYTAADVAAAAGASIHPGGVVVDRVRVRCLEEPARVGPPLVPCPDRGSHRKVTDCWLCWSDVMTGRALEPEVITADAWREDVGE